MVAGVKQAESADFDSVMVSDHFHPWLECQGESPFVWAVLEGHRCHHPTARRGADSVRDRQW